MSDLTSSLLDYSFDSEGCPTDWTLKELRREAELFAGIILTSDGGRHDVPIGGAVKRTSSAIAMSGWLPDTPPLRKGEHWVQRYLLPAITGQIYSENIFMKDLRLFPRRPPARQAVWTAAGWKMEPVNRSYAKPT